MLEESRASQSRQEPSAEDHLSGFSAIRTRAAADSGRGSDARLQCGRPTYVPSVPQPPQMAITVSYVGASVHTHTHTHTHTSLPWKRMANMLELIVCSQHLVVSFLRPSGCSWCLHEAIT
ncbi:hypothetical protein ILYODFUR_006811 [Ilyodon furcidens]|uniref:Uncharacterized protein n=1 Tax=Ilyodon furcidens TaxID=33524 RepID=A0ABV0T774_9TELE